MAFVIASAKALLCKDKACDMFTAMFLAPATDLVHSVLTVVGMMVITTVS